MSDRPALLPEFNSFLYRELHADLAAFSAEEAKAHYVAFGAHEGRIATLADTREGFLSEMVFKERGDLLEIGPVSSPVLSGPSVYYADCLNEQPLPARSRDSERDWGKNTGESHDLGDLSAIGREFDAIFCSHVIERQPNLVGHLNQISKLLMPGGRYYLVISDKRFCSDSLLGESSIAEVVQAYHEQHMRHSLATIIAHLALTTHDDPLRHWANDHGSLDETATSGLIDSAVRSYGNAGDRFIDARAWHFTPVGFRTILTMLRLLKLIELVPVRIYNTPRDRQEFCAILEGPSSGKGA